MWQGWLTAIVGIWVGIVPYLNLDASTEKIVLIVSGIVLLALGIWDAVALNKCEGQTGQMQN